MGDLFGLVGSIALIIAGLAFMGMSKLSTLINGIIWKVQNWRADDGR